MNFEYLNAFVAVVETGSFRKASDSLNKAQPAVSYLVKSLESDLNLKLFDRSSYKPTLTSDGHFFYKRSKKILKEIEDFKGHATFLSKGGDAEVKMSITALFPIGLISKKLKSFSEENKFTDLKINVDVLSTMFRLENEEVQIGISELIQWPYDKYETYELCKVKMTPVLSSEHPLFLRKQNIFDTYDIQNIPQIVIQSTMPESKGISSGVINENLKWRVSDFKTKETMLLESLGWGFMPEHMVKDHLKSKALRILELKNNPIFNLPIYAIRSRNPKVWSPSLESLWLSLMKK